jgi:hypothetical protein
MPLQLCNSRAVPPYKRTAPNAYFCLMADHLSITYRSDLQALIVRWLAPLSDEQVRADYEMVEAAAKENNNCRLWMFDVRRRSLGSDEFNSWVGDTYFPRLAKELKGPVSIAFLATPRQLAGVVLGSGQDAVEQGLQAGVRCRFFADEGPAQTWLTGH